MEGKQGCQLAKSPLPTLRKPSGGNAGVIGHCATQALITVLPNDNEPLEDERRRINIQALPNFVP